MLYMCSSATRLWCCRIIMLLSVSAVLLSMMFQIWSYYFSLVRDMDALSVSGPSVGAIVSVCNETLIDTWNIDCSKGARSFFCRADVNDNIYVDSTCVSDWHNISLNECCRVMIWILPW
jgi:hypothetical protein